jgi:D-lyxose ketol-isomerase
MKRSQINFIMRDGLGFLRRRRFALPPFAFWTPAEWRGRGPEAREIADRQLGWDITDFGCGDFDRTGLFLFTLRNGTPVDSGRPPGKTYAEKIMIVRENQVTPTHFHHEKMEDIVNRGGGRLVMRLWNATAEDGLADTPVTVSRDGVRVTVPAGGEIVLRPGESVCLPPRNYHRFWGQQGRGPVLVGEVSRVNDDRVDNRFFDPVGRFPTIEEDEEPLYLLCGDYARYYVNPAGRRV